MRHRIRCDRWFIPLLWLMGTSPTHACAYIDQRELVVRMGWGFSARIPLRQIVMAKLDNGPVWGWGVHGWRGRWLVNGSGRGMVMIEINPRVRARVLGIPIGLNILRLSLEDPAAFLADLH